MPPQTSGPLGPRRKIAAVLKQWREESGESLNDVAEALLISTSKLSRLENAEGKPRLRDVRDLVQHYGKEKTPQAGQLPRLVKASEVNGWWTNFDDNVLVEHIRLDTHIAYEADATVERVYTIPFIPIHLQTKAYAAAYYQDLERRPTDQMPELLQIREKRKEALKHRNGLDPLRLIAVTHECSLRQIVGSAQVMREQLDELLVRSGEENVALHVFPFSATPAPTMTCMYAYFQYEDPEDPEDLEQDVVQIETQDGFLTIDNPKDVKRYRDAHAELVAAALSEDDSRTLIRSIRDGLLLPQSEL
jgi:transcriptional regulator with XRE-family HTH domain